MVWCLSASASRTQKNWKISSLFHHHWFLQTQKLAIVHPNAADTQWEPPVKRNKLLLKTLTLNRSKLTNSNTPKQWTRDPKKMTTTSGQRAASCNLRPSSRSRLWPVLPRSKVSLHTTKFYWVITCSSSTTLRISRLPCSHFRSFNAILARGTKRYRKVLQRLLQVSSIFLVLLTLD